MCRQEKPQIFDQEYIQIELQNCLENKSQSQLIMTGIRTLLEIDPTILTGQMR